MGSTRLFFTDSSVDRSCDVRLDDAALQALRAAENARYLLVRRGRVKAEPGPPIRVAWLRAHELPGLGVEILATVFLGMHDGGPRFAVIPAEAPLTANDRMLSSTDDRDFLGLRRAAMLMPPAEAQMAGYAVHLSNWLNRNRYCGMCAAPTRIVEGGHKLACTDAKCGREEFPRTDPVMITLVTFEDRCLLARQPTFPPKFYSALAGFVEPGETLEAAVRREVREESGVHVDDVTYVGSQPWPFPTSLMVGYLARAASDRLKLDNRELEDGRWFERAEIAQLCGGAPGAEPPVLLPPKGVMARRLIDEWLLGRS